MDHKQALREYRTQHGNSRARSIPFELTFREWCEWWQATGLYDQRGSAPDQYAMVRHDASGAFSTDNIKCVTNRQAAEQFWTSPRRNQAMQHNRRISQQNRRPISTPDGIFPSIQAAAQHYQMSPSGLRWRIANHTQDYYYMTEVMQQQVP